jgi:predicted aldo/keto reductase-like oxidoreductase
VRVADILRYRMYYEQYKEQKAGIEKYRQVPAALQAGTCGNCAAPCEPACPYGVAIGRRLAGAHQMLSLA